MNHLERVDLAAAFRRFARLGRHESVANRLSLAAGASILLVCLAVRSTAAVAGPKTPGAAAVPDAAASRAAARQRAAVDRFITAQMREQDIPGLSLGVLKDSTPIYVKSYGVATLEHAVPVKPQTLFQIGSIGKQFTSTALMLLARDHQLELDDPLSKYLPEIPSDWQGVTLRTMLSHQSGIPQLTPPDRALLDLHHDYTDEEYIKLATSLPLDFEPGTDAAYSDTAYVLLGFVINRVAGRFYGDLLAERVFRPLAMRRTRIISDIEIIPDRAAGYERGPAGTLQNQGWVAPALNRTADGSLYSTVLDLALWDEALGKSRILTAAERSRAWTIDPLRDGTLPLLHYGYGWEINSLRGHPVIEYDGNWQGFQAAMARYEDRHLTVIVLTNLSLCRTQRIAHTVAGYFDRDLAHFESAVRDSHPNLTQLFQVFLDQVQHRSVDPASLTEAGRKAVSPVWVGALARDLRATGPISGTTFAEERATPRGLERVYRVETREMVDFFTVRYGARDAMESIALYHEY